MPPKPPEPSKSAKPPKTPSTGEFGARVRAARAARNLSQEQLAAGTALHWSYIGQVERGAVNPTLHSILTLADVLEVDAGTLISGLPVPARD